jgi:hypothetical protein
MSVCRLVAGLVGLALAAVVVTVLVAVGGEVRAELAPAVVKEDTASAAPAFSSACLQAPWVSMAERSGQADRSRCTADLKHTANIPLAVTRSSA